LLTKLLFNINNIAISERIGEVPLVEQELLSDKDDNKNCAISGAGTA
jgi:hypothetical protein